MRGIVNTLLEKQIKCIQDMIMEGIVETYVFVNLDNVKLGCVKVFMMYMLLLVNSSFFTFNGLKLLGLSEGCIIFYFYC